jgi:hypothetical protein
MPDKRDESKHDENQVAFAIVAAALGAPEESGRELLESEESKRLYDEAKARLLAEEARKKPVK